jgi:hypothetical protein
MSAKIVNLSRCRVRRACNAVRRERLLRLQAEWLLCLLAQCCRDHQGHLDRATERLQQQLRRRVA